MNNLSSFELMKNRNQKKVLKTIKENGGISRASIAQLTGLSPATVTNLVNNLMENNLIKETSRGKSKGGRKPVKLELDNIVKIIGIEWSINKIKYVLLNFKGEIEEKGIEDIKNNSFNYYFKKTKLIVDKILDKYKNDPIQGIGLGIHGIIDSQKGISVFAPHFKWNNIEVLEEFKNNYDIPIRIDNDVRMMARTERWQGKENFVFISTGQGIGSAIVVNNNLIYGKDYLAGEIGHIMVKEDGPQCNCGNYGCLEAMISRKELIKRAKKIDNNINNFNDLKILINEEKEGFKKIIDYITKYLGIAVINLINILDPTEIIIGGDLIDIQSKLINSLNNFIKDHSMNKKSELAVVNFAKDKKYTGAVGAGISILENYF